MAVKETTWVVLATMACATIGLAVGKVDPQQWTILMSVATGGKALQGTADRLMPKGAGSVRPDAQ